MKKNVAALLVALIACIPVFAQKTAEELKAERAELKAEMKSKDAKKNEKTFNKLAPKGGSMADIVELALYPMPNTIKAEVEAPLKKFVGDKEARIINKPAPTGLNSVDGLIGAGTSLLSVITATDEVLAEYKIAITESKDGEIDIQKFAANKDDYMAIVPLLTQAGIDAAKAVAQIKQVKSDIQGLNPMSAISTINAGKWAIDAVNVASYKITQSTKLIQNLVEGCKAAKNL